MMLVISVGKTLRTDIKINQQIHILFNVQNKGKRKINYYSTL